MTLSEENKKTINERLRDLPPDYATFITSTFVRDLSEFLKTKHQLDETVTTSIENELLLTLLLFIPPSELKEEISQETGLDRVKVDGIFTDIKTIIPDSLWKTLEDIEKREPTEEETNKNTVESKEQAREPGLSAGKEIPKGKQELYERLHLRPEDIKSKLQGTDGPGVQPITKDEVMSSLSASRTMQGDIQNIKGKSEKDTPKDKK